MAYICELVELSRECFGESGKPFLIGLLVGAAGEGELGKRVKDTLAPKQAVEILNGIEALLEAPNTEITSRVGV